MTRRSPQDQRLVRDVRSVVGAVLLCTISGCVTHMNLAVRDITPGNTVSLTGATPFPVHHRRADAMPKCAPLEIMGDVDRVSGDTIFFQRAFVKPHSAEKSCPSRDSTFVVLSETSARNVTRTRYNFTDTLVAVLGIFAILGYFMAREISS